MRRTVIALTLIGSLISQPSLLDTFWSFLSTVWSESDAGCGADPDGRCRPAPQPDAGCGADPDGCPKGS